MQDGKLRGATFGLLAAALFGASAPVAKLLLDDLPPVLLAGLLYTGAALGVWGYRIASPRSNEAPLRRADAPTLTIIAVSGGLLAPVLMLYGLAQVPAFAGSLLLTLEAPFTVALAVLLFGEHLGRRGVFAVLAITLGAVLLSAVPSNTETSAPGLARVMAGGLLIAGACLCWALDNNLTQKLSVRDPFAVVRVKTLAAGLGNTALGLTLMPSELPSLTPVLTALVLGGVSYGASVVLDAYALRYIGAAREAAFMATAPFVGALFSAVLFEDAVGALEIGALILMASGVVALLNERHHHEHTHEAVTHEHLHIHDAHHQHTHETGHATDERHSHEHTHEALRHDHPHLPDIHHRHRH